MPTLACCYIGMPNRAGLTMSAFRVAESSRGCKVWLRHNKGTPQHPLFGDQATQHDSRFAEPPPAPVLLVHWRTRVGFIMCPSVRHHRRIVCTRYQVCGSMRQPHAAGRTAELQSTISLGR